MAKMNTKTTFKKVEETFRWDHKTIGTFFLGVGFIMFILNVTTIISLLQNNFQTILPMGGYYTSTISSIVLMAYSLYNIYKY